MAEKILTHIMYVLSIFLFMTIWTSPIVYAKLTYIEDFKSIYNYKNDTGIDDSSRLPIVSYFMGRYYLKFFVGTPSQEILLEFDTGGRQPWVPCLKSSNSIHTFDALASSSCHDIVCNSQLCTSYYKSFLPTGSCNQDYPFLPCEFLECYVDGNCPGGVLAQDLFTLGSKNVEFPNITFGCAYEGVKNFNLQLPFNNWAYGNIGLNHGEGSFFDQVASKDNVLSYCLAPHFGHFSPTSWASFERQSANNLSYTPLLEDPEFYIVNLSGITIGDVVIDVSSTTMMEYDSNTQCMAVILDSGAGVCTVPEPLFSKFQATFVDVMKETTNNYPLGNIDPHNEICYKFDDTDITNIYIPNVTFHLQNDVDLNLRSENIFMSANPNVRDYQWCLAFMQGDSAIFGNILQQNFHIELDVKQKKVGFARTKC